MAYSIRKLAAAVACVAVSGAAQAAIESVDWDAAAHDQWLTRDTASGLEWLDVSLTTGQTMSQVLAGDWIARGFRYATSQEVTTLFEHAGVAGSGSPEGWLGTALNGQLTFNQGTQALALVHMLGGATPTLLDGLTGSDALGNAIPAGPLGSDLKLRAISLSAQMTDAGAAALCTLVCVDGGIPSASSTSPSIIEFMLRLQLGPLLPADWKSLPAQGTSTITVQGLPVDAQTALLGSYLVRETPAVPEPSAWALLLAGGLALAGATQRRNR